MRSLAQIIKEKLNSVPSKTIALISLACAAALIPVWSIPHAMAARNILFFGSLIGVVFSGLNWSNYKGRLNLFILLCFYLVFQILFFSTDITVAIKNFRSEWLRFILCFVLGLGIALIISGYRAKNILLWLGILFAIPPLIHLIQIIYVWGVDGKFPLGYLGFYSMHGDLAYTSLASIILLSVYLHFQAARQREYFLSYVFLAICLISPAVAKSRGGVLFGIFAITIIFLSAILNQRLSKRSSSRRLINIACLVMAITCAVNVLIMSDPVRASGVFKRIQLGFIVAANSSDYFCDRNSTSSSAALSASQISSELSDADALNLTEGDGSRVIAAITGARLAAEHPMGINQSRQAFQTALIIHCGFAPKNMLSHSHSGWINLALAIGLPGAIIFLALQIAILRYGIQNRAINNAINPFAFALIFWTLIWTVRAMFDASLQDHVMEIQAFILALLLGLAINFTKCSDLKK